MNLLFSEEDKDLRELNWHPHTAGYANRWYGSRPSRTKLFAHRVVLERKLGRPLTSKDLCDHVNRNKLDNRRENLRLADKSLNTINRGRKAGAKNPYVGVYLHISGRWKAEVTRQGKTTSVGYFATPEESNHARISFLKEKGIE